MATRSGISAGKCFRCKFSTASRNSSGIPTSPTLLTKEQQRRQMRRNLKEYSRTLYEDAAEENNIKLWLSGNPKAVNEQRES
ncbi:hypothetical protein B0H21DRAFT_822094 [Amylocystis lapponica]|nr:hypothetical protein B0H21DRAFT_822094 [Amylocystis lapponica]